MVSEEQGKYFVKTSSEPLRALVIGWVPGGDRSALNSIISRILDPA